MRAVRMHERGGPERLTCEEAPPPTPGAGDALVRVHACAITPTELSWSATYTTRDGRDRLPSIPGHEVSGVVEAVAPSVTEPRVGDAVYALTDFWRNGRPPTSRPEISLPSRPAWITRRPRPFRSRH